MFNDIFLYSNFALNIGCLIVGLIIDRFVRKFVKLSRYEPYRMTYVKVHCTWYRRNSELFKGLECLLVDVFRQ